MIPLGHGGIKIFDTSDLSALVGDPTEPNSVGYIPAADEAEGAPLRTSHNFEAPDSKVHTSWYQDGVRLWDVEDPTKSTELTAWVPQMDRHSSGDETATVGIPYSRPTSAL